MTNQQHPISKGNVPTVIICDSQNPLSKAITKKEHDKSPLKLNPVKDLSILSEEGHSLKLS